MEDELKFQVDEARFQQLKETVTNQGFTISERKEKIDDYYIVEQDTRYLRICHLENGTGLLDYHVYETVEMTKEHRVEVSNIQEMDWILKHLGYERICRVKKERTVYSDGEKSVSFDFIEALGHFVELEMVSTQEATAQLWAWARELGLADYPTIDVRYADLMVSLVQAAS